jgi:NAD(P)-dependent dehydrogenase (short-subunit alcohol dehydrogenase family)
MGAGLGNNGEDEHLRINHLGPFLLTRLLLPLIGIGGRIVNVASRAHQQGSLVLQDGEFAKTPTTWCEP